ncbi:MAG: glutamine amidotransferase [Rhodobacteraceae bacterium]|nr:glutamine amidotransferase [Paracoccaceae bacterium]
MTSVLAIRHVAFETLGILEDIFADRGWNYGYAEAGTAQWATLDPMASDLVVILGGPIGATDDATYPFIAHEIAFIEKRLAARKPILGICLGAQMIARALGAQVYPGPAKEIGWSPLFLTGAGHTSPCRHFTADQCFMFHWHGDTFDLPEDAVNLAFTEACAHQSFVWNDIALAFQCHPEVRAREIENWLIGHAVEIAATPGVTVTQVRADTIRYGAAMERQGRACFEEWFDTIKLV